MADVPEKAVKRNPPPPLLATLMSDTLDPGYARAAARKAAAREHHHAAEGAHRDGTAGQNARRAGRRAVAWLAGGSILLGILLGIAAANTRANAPKVDQVRSALVVDISAAQDREDLLAASVSALGADLRARQSALGTAGPLRELATLEEMNAQVAVTGPGLSILLTDPKAATGEGTILDKDLQVMVNGLWSAGAEAISVGGVRLRVTSAIRQAGSAILVDNRPVLWPLTVEAIGDPAKLHPRFVNTLGFARFTAFVQLYGIGFDVTVADDLKLAAAPAVDARYVRSVGSSQANSSQANSTQANSSQAGGTRTPSGPDPVTTTTDPGETATGTTDLTGTEPTRTVTSAPAS
ncbi:DUF881 domain-containing protein [Nakamurella silvestris]|nr:DUF881 domain-containing protein [Nakamurella silvestris]